MKKNDTTFQKAVSAGKKRNYKEAVTLLLEIIHNGDDQPDAFLYLGRSYYALGKYAMSIQYLRIFLEYFPQSPTGHFFIGRSYLASGLVKKSINHFKFSLREHPESIHARSFLSIALMKMGRFETALTYLGEAVELSPEQTKVFEIYLHCLLVVAIRKFNAGDSGVAQQMFTFYLGYIQDKVLPYIYLGMIERQNDNDEKALEYYEEAIKLSPQDELLLFRRAVLLYKTGQRNDALEQLNRLQPGEELIESLENINENRFLAIKYFQQKKFKEALYFGREALKENNNDSDMHLVMGEVFRTLKKTEYARNHYKIAIKLDKSRVEFRYGYALLLWGMEEYDEMLKELQKIRELDPENQISGYYTALLYCKLGYGTETTIPALQEQIHLNPTDAFLFQYLGNEYIRGGLENLAEKWLLKAKSLTGGTPELYKSLIETYRKTNETDKFIHTVEEYFETGSFDYDIALEYLYLLYSLKRYKETIKEAEFILGFQKNNKVTRILANSCRLTGKYNKATIFYRYLLKEDPHNSVYLKALVFCMDKGGRTEESITLLENALHYIKKPQNTLYLILGVLYYKTGKSEAAQKIFRDSISKFPDDWRAYENLGTVYKDMGMTDFADRFLSEAAARKRKK